MTAPLLWTYDRVVRFVDHPDVPVRRWALERLTQLFPDRAGQALIEMVDDSGTFIASKALDFLAETGDGATYGPALLDHLRQAQDDHFGSLAQALARLDYREALPLVVERLDRSERGGEALETNAYLKVVVALGTFGGDEARRALWSALDNFDRDRFWLGAPMEVLLHVAEPHDIVHLVQFHRSWPLGPGSDRMVGAFATVVGATRLFQEISQAPGDGLDAALERAARWLGRDPPLSESCVRDLRSAFRDRHRDVFQAVLDEARRILKERGNDLGTWRADWERGERPEFEGYRWRAMATLLTLEAFAAHPALDPEQRAMESSLALALLCQLSVDRDDQAYVEVAEDPAEALLDLLAEDREQMLPNIFERVADLGPEIVPRLLDRFDADRPGWGTVHIAQAIARLARFYPGSCDAAILTLIESISEEQGDYACEACAAALAAIGPAAVPAIAAHIRDDDRARWIYLYGVLDEIPTEGSAQIVLDWIADGLPVDELQFGALARIGSSSAIEPLYELWQGGGDDYSLVEALLVLCEVNNVQKPDLPEWRRIVRAKEARMARGIDDFEFFSERAISEPEGPLAEKESSPAPSAPKASKQEHQKRRRRRKKRRKR